MMAAQRARFAELYLATQSATRAYQATHPDYKGRNAGKLAWEMLQHPEVQAAVKVAAERQMVDAAITMDSLLVGLRTVAFLDIAELYDSAWTLKPMRSIPREVRQVIQSIEIVRVNLAPNDGVQERLHKVTLMSKVKAYELLMKHYKMLTEVTEVNTDWDKLVQQLNSARNREPERPPTRMKD